MEQCEMLKKGIACMYEQCEDNYLFACPLSERECLYGNSSKKGFTSYTGEILHVCKTKGLVKRAGLMDLTEAPKVKFSCNGVMIKP